jgi:rhodanese-related sulfurtransferase
VAQAVSTKNPANGVHSADACHGFPVTPWLCGGKQLLTAILILIAVGGAAVLLTLEIRKRNRAELDRHSISAADLRQLLNFPHDFLLLDVRQPLDLLAYPEILPGAKRIPPDDVLANPDVIPRDKDTIVYCTCPGEKTSRRILRQALSLHFTRIRFLRGGLAAWKAQGYPVEKYTESFQLYVPGRAQSAS